MAEAASRITGKPACASARWARASPTCRRIQCAMVENSPVIFLGGQRARVTERRVRRGRIQFVQQEPLFENSVKYAASIEYADQTDEIIREAIRIAMSGTPGPAYIEFPCHVILEDLDVPDPLPPSRYRLVNQGADVRQGRRGRRADQRPRTRSCWSATASTLGTRRGGQGTGRPDEVPGDPDLGRHLLHPGPRRPHLPYGFSSAVEAVVKSDLCIALGTELGEPSHYGRGAALGGERSQPQVDLRPAGSHRDRREPPDRRAAGRRPPRRRAAAGRRAEGHPAPASADLDRWIKEDAEELAELAENRRRAGRTPIHTARFVVEATKGLPARTAS